MLFLILSGKNYKNSGQYIKAIYCIEEAILRTDTENFGMLGKLYYLRGSILSSIHRKAEMDYPLTLIPKHTANVIPTHCAAKTNGHCLKIFEKRSNVLQEAIATFNRAYIYFKYTVDDVFDFLKTYFSCM